MKIFLSNARSRALTMVDLCVVMAVLAVLVFFAIFSMGPGSGRKVKERALRVQCINNLKQTGLAFDMWAGDHGQKFPMEISQPNGGTMEYTSGPNEWRHFQVMSNEFISHTPRVLYCPADERRTPATNFSFMGNSNLSFFLNLDFSRPNPQSIWSGDRNLTTDTPISEGILELTTNPPAAWTAEMHHKMGNLLLFDGSVLRADDAGLRNAIANSGTSTNRLQMPVLSP